MHQIYGYVASYFFVCDSWMMLSHIDAESYRKIEQMVQSMPAFPRSVHKVLDLAVDMNCAPKDIVQVIEHDPVMTAKMLQLVNSAFYSLPRQITSMKHAVVYLGINTVKNLALSIATVGMLPKHNKANFDMSAFLLHALMTGFIARELSKLVDKEGFDAADFFVAGLLHDFGKVVLLRSEPEKFAQALMMAEEDGLNLVEAEMRVFGMDHCSVGAVLGETWRFPDALVQAIAEHHQPDVASNVLRDCVYVGNQICKSLSIGHAGNVQVEPIVEGIDSRFNSDLESLIGSIGNIEPLMEEARVFASL